MIGSCFHGLLTSASLACLVSGVSVVGLLLGNAIKHGVAYCCIHQLVLIAIAVCIDRAIGCRQQL